MQFEYDPEKLIEEVKKRPGIWDYEHPDYRAKNLRYKLWNEVVNELMQTDVKMSKSEMRELEIQLQKKWKSIRDCFQKYIINPKRTKRPYIYSKQLQFLLKDQELPRRDTAWRAEQERGSAEGSKTQLKRKWKIIRDYFLRFKRKSHLGNKPHIYSDKLQFLTKNKVKRLSKKERKRNAESSNMSNECSKTGTISKNKKKPKATKSTEDVSSEEETDSAAGTQEDSSDSSNDDYDTRQVKSSKNNKSITVDTVVRVDCVNSKSDSDADPDRLFLLSLLPHLITIPEELRFKVKMELMQVLKTANHNWRGPIK